MLHWIWTILIGFVVGFIAKAITPGKDPGGFIITAVIGVAGSVFASFLGQSIGWYHAGQTAGFLGSVVGAVLLLVLYNFFKRKSS